jgi:hypothetical protein
VDWLPPAIGYWVSLDFHRTAKLNSGTGRALGGVRMIATKPLPITDPRVYRPRRIPVTIAIGFAYDTGLLFCVDTKVSTNIKTNESKLAHFVSDDTLCSLTFAMSSTDLNFPRNAVERCWDAVKGMDFKKVSIEAVHDAAEFALAEFYRDHIYPHPDRTPGATFLELLVGIWLRGETQLYVSHETVLNLVDHYECIGSGAYLAKYLIRKYLKADTGATTEQDAGLIANYAVEQAIEYDEYCGGEAEMLILRQSGTVDSICPAVLYPGERFISGLQGTGWKLIHDLARVKDNHESETASLLEEYFDKIRAMNGQYYSHFEALRDQKIREPHRWD